MPDAPDSPRDARPHGATEDGRGPLVAFTREPSRPLDNLPIELSSFIGREREMAEVKRLLTGHRLLTLTGPGGCGKTRLALAVAADLVEEFEDGVWWVGLASLSDPTLVPQVVAGALSVREQPNRPLVATLVDAVCPERMLLVLDNCEHLIEACSQLADTLLNSCPQLRILATSREALGIAGEANWRVPSLSLPETGHLLVAEDLTGYEAVKLFVERARSRLPTFEVTPENAGAVAEVCRKLEGIPLAIELATARVAALTVEQIAERLKAPLGLLTAGRRTAAPRHQTLRATLDWSHDLLGEQENRLFGRLSVFAGGWTLEAAEVVCSGDGIEEMDVLDLLGRLVDKSLVWVEAGSEDAARYGMLEPVRQYGREKLEESGEAEAVLRRHADFFLALAEQAEPELKEPRQVSWLKRLDEEQDNLRAAMVWLLGSEESETAARLGWALWLFWWIRGRFAEGRRWMEEALATGAPVPTTARAKALFVAGTMADGQDDYRSAAALLEKSIGLFRELEDKRGAAYALSSAGFAAIGQQQHEKGIALLEEGVALSLEVGEKWGAAYMLCFLATVWRDRGDTARAKRLAEQGLALSREVGDREGISVALYILAGLAQAERDHDRARRLLKEGLELSAEVGDETNVAYCLEGLAAVAAAEGSIARAAGLWGAAEALLEEIEAAAYVYAPDRYFYENQVTAAREALGEEAFAVAWAQGRAMAVGQAIAYALSEPATLSTDPVPPSGPDSAEPKTSEELRIVALGPTRVERGGRVLTSSDWGYAKPKEMLYYLLCHSSRTREQIGLALWPDASPEQLRSSFHTTLHRLRRALGRPDRVVFEKGHYSFNRSLRYSFDVEAFESSLAEARRFRNEERAISYLKEALELYGGDFLQDFTEAGWASDRREELRQAYLKGLLSLGGLLLEEGRHNEAAEAYRKVVARDELLEAAHRGLMRCYARQGERGRAIRHYEALVELLREELGMPPAPETTELYEHLRRSEKV